MGVQPHSAHLARTRPEDPPSEIKKPAIKVSFFLFFMRVQSDRVHSAGVDDSCTFFVCAEENREVCATTHFGGAHLLG